VISKIVFKGAFGKIDGLYSHSKNSTAPAVLLVSNNNEKVIRRASLFHEAANSVFDTFVENDFSTLKFDLVEHTVEKNEIDHAHLMDMTAALDWLHNKNLECRNFWICGLDYSAFVTLQLVMRRPELENYIIISPSLRRNDLNFIIPCSACGFIIRGSEDLKFTEEDCLNLQEKLITKAESKVRYTTIYKAERNFADELQQLKNELTNYICQKTVEDRKNMKQITASKRRRRKKKSPYADEEKIAYVNPVKSLDIGDI
jgi:alpha/beta superfamily hydrolase